ncbi:MAG: helicase-related protein, partial [Verrucomicrobiae bacterium]|nr:helicase-related protein [Verrucomicrobiae bacterium]
MTPLAQTARRLPIWSLRDQLRAAWRRHNRLVLIAPTGSGKTTQVCQMLLEDGRVGDKQIVVLQPRRVAARAAAARVAAERGARIGGEIGYQIRFDDRASPDTRILFVTEGVLLRRLQDEPALPNVGAVLFDEFHERNLFSDVALGLVKQLQAAQRPDLFACVMSATLDAEPVAAFLGGCPVLRSEGRSFPVTIQPLDAPDRRPVQEVAADAVERILVSGKPGDILVFMPGVWEIQQTLNAIRGLRLREPLTLLPLYGELPPEEQDRVFQPSPARKIIVATNVAETSVTIEGVRFVVDSGLARIARYDPALGISALRIEPISHASADQRAGRAGRTAPGECWRLWTLADHQGRPKANTPEIRRTDLAGVVLLLCSLGVQDVAGFDLPDRMDPAAVRTALDMLEGLGALETGTTRVTDIGRQMLRLPVHPRYARMLIEASRRGCVHNIALWAALVSGRDLLVRSREESARGMLEMFQTNENSDFFTLARAFHWARQRNFSLDACRRAGIHALTAANVEDTYEQLLDLCEKNGLRMEKAAANDDDLLKCVLAGFADHLARRVSRGTLECMVVGGRAGTLARESVVQNAALFVPAEMRQIVGRDGKELTLLGLASEVKLEWLREMFPTELQSRLDTFFDPATKRVCAEERLRFRDLMLETRRVEPPPADEAARLLAEEILAGRLALKDWDHSVEQWIVRLNNLARWCPELALPPITDDDRRHLLEQLCHGSVSY